MPVRNFAPALKNPSNLNPERIAIEFQPQDGDTPAPDRRIILELKQGATEDQAKALHMSLSLLGACIVLEPAA